MKIFIAIIYFHSTGDKSSVNSLKSGIGITSTVYEVGSCGENEKNITYVRCKDRYEGFLVFARTDDRGEAIGEVMDHCRSKRLQGIKQKSGPSSPGWVYVVGKKVY